PRALSRPHIVTDVVGGASGPHPAVPQRGRGIAKVRVDLHTHSSASFDCRIAPINVARRCRQLGLSPVVLTDHDTIDGARSLADTGEPVVIGQEILTTEGEMIGLFLKEAVAKRLLPEEAIASIKGQGGLVYLEHPYDTGRRNLREET